MTTELATTPLFDWHASHHGRMVDFAGWSMPVQYASIVEEHQATRKAMGLFDISHMGRLRFDGAAAAPLLDRLLTRRVAGLDAGKIRYSLVTNEQGGILDDVLVYHLAGDSEPDFHLLVVNASNRAKIVAWIEQHRGNADVAWRDVTLDTAMIAVQGPRALEVAGRVLDSDLTRLDYYTGGPLRIDGQPAIVSRTGYTGEDGCELIVPAGIAESLWARLLEAGQAAGARPAGLGARDTLRLEAAMPLYGHELSEEIHPYQAGLGFAVQLKDRDFIGRDALLQLKQARYPQRIGIRLPGKRVPREGFPVLRRDDVVGRVTSGTFSPTLQCPIAMAYVGSEAAEPGSDLRVDVRGKLEPGQVVKLPFYERSSGKG